MSGLAAFALGLCAQQALLGRTWAGASVLLEPASPVEPTTPVIAIYCGRGYSKVEGRDLLNAGAHVALRFEMFAPASTVAAGFTFSSDSAQALVFACLGRQIETVFLTDAGVWAELWRRFVFAIETREGARDLFENDKGQKLAVAVEEWRLETLAEPQIGAAPVAFWADLIAAMTASGGELAALASLIALQVQGSTAILPQVQIDQGVMGVNGDEMGVLGLTIPLDDVLTVGDGLYTPPPLQEVGVSANDDDLIGQ